MTWSDIPAAAKMATASVVVIMAMVGYLTTFHTDAEAAEMEQRVNKSLKEIRVDNVEAEIAAYELQLIDANVPERKREWLERKIQKLEEKKKCIRKGEC